MCTATITYECKVSHPTNFHSGSHEFKVYMDEGGGRFVTSDDFGCSRDYFTKSDQEAIKIFLGEHGTKMVSCKVK